ncbi:TetR family transcriptional regulator [Streptomyces sp. NPDC005813]|uniref:TetR/AcrR family transcriptional regulator n=1 Tax=Streptomyces sp. NPDC005813 TaxID=3155592 RepID=UPI0033D9E141
MDSEQVRSRRGRAHDPEGNRRAVLDAARRLFSAHGYAGAGIRAIAAEAGVTPGLVMAYFGTKDGLFLEAVGAGTGVTGAVLDAVANDPDQLPRALAHAYLERWDRLPDQDPWPALIRSALSHPPSAELFRGILDQQVSEPLVRLIGESVRSDVRLAMVRSILFGVIMERYMFAHEPARSVPTEQLEPALADVLATAVGAREATPEAGSAGSARADAGLVRADTGPVRADTGPTVEAPAPEELFGPLQACLQRYRALTGAVVKDFGIGVAASEVLDALRRAGAPYRRTMGEVAGVVSLSQGGLTMQADRLAESGLIERERDGRDRRIVRLRLTPAGLDLAARVADARAAGEREMLAGLGAAEQGRLRDLLALLGRSLDEAGPEHAEQRTRATDAAQPEGA